MSIRLILYATSNPGKVQEVRKYLQSFDIPLLAPADLGISIEVEETGLTLEANATLKAQAYLAQMPDMVVMADDTGVEIDALHGEPGIHVRRWRDRTTAMSDHAIIDYCMQRMQGIPPSHRGAQFRTVLALGHRGEAIALFDGVLRGTIVETPAPLTIPGFPFETMFFIPEWGKLLGDIHTYSIEDKLRHNYLTHRERAVKNAVPRLREFLDADGT